MLDYAVALSFERHPDYVRTFGEEKRLERWGRAERKMERTILADYEATLEEILNKLSPANHATALRLANLPDEIRGYGHVKEANVAKARKAWDTLLATFRDPAPLRQAAE